MGGTFADDGVVERWDDATRTYTRWVADVEEDTRPYTDGENAAADSAAAAAAAAAAEDATEWANANAIRAQAATTWADLGTYLALGAASTAAQDKAAARLMARCLRGLIRLSVGKLDGID